MHDESRKHQEGSLPYERTMPNFVDKGWVWLLKGSEVFCSDRSVPRVCCKCLAPTSTRWILPYRKPQLWVPLCDACTKLLRLRYRQVVLTSTSVALVGAIMLIATRMLNEP